MQATVAALRAAHDELAALPIDALTKPELVGVLDELETLTCQLPTQSHRMLARLQAETTAKEMGAKSWRDVLAIRWRISSTEAGRRLDEAAQLGPRRTLTGEPLEPVLPCTALAQAHGLINREHVQGCARGDGAHPARGRRPHPRPDRSRSGAHRDRGRAQGTQGQRRPDPVPPRPGRTRTRRHRTRAAPRRVEGAAGPRQDDPAQGQPQPRSVGDLRGDLRQVGRTRDVQPRRRAPVRLGDSDAGADRQRPPQSGAAPARRARRGRAQCAGKR